MIRRRYKTSGISLGRINADIQPEVSFKSEQSPFLALCQPDSMGHPTPLSMTHLSRKENWWSVSAVNCESAKPHAFLDLGFLIRPRKEAAVKPQYAMSLSAKGDRCPPCSPHTGVLPATPWARSVVLPRSVRCPAPALHAEVFSLSPPGAN